MLLGILLSKPVLQVDFAIAEECVKAEADGKNADRSVDDAEGGHDDLRV